MSHIELLMNKKSFMTIIIPVKDEQDNISWIIEKLEKIVLAIYEVLIIYDSENDKTVPIVKQMSKRYKNLHLLKNIYGYGVLNAIKTGIKKSHGEVLVIMAADRTDDPRTINKMYHKILQGYDVICPTRYSKGGEVIGKISLKSILSKLSGLSAPLFLGVPTSDLTYSFKMFRKRILSEIEIESKGGFEFAEELLIKSHFAGFKIIEVPTIWIDRKYGKSKFMLIAWLPQYIYWYLFGISKRINGLRRKFLKIHSFL